MALKIGQKVRVKKTGELTIVEGIGVATGELKCYMEDSYQYFSPSELSLVKPRAKKEKWIAKRGFIVNDRRIKSSPKKEGKIYKVMIKNFVENKYQPMKLIYDPRTGKSGLAIYDNRKDAELCLYIALALSGGAIKAKIIIDAFNSTKERGRGK